MTSAALEARPLPWSRPLDPVGRQAALALLRRLGHGELRIVEAGRTQVFRGRRRGPRATVRVHSPHAFAAVLSGGIGMARSYVHGLWDCDDLVSLVRLLARNLEPLDAARSRLQPLLEPWQLATGVLRGVNTRRRSHRRIQAHYDLGNDLFAAMLDDTMMYSCAIFPSPEATLRTASVHKMETICRKLRLAADDHLLEIGSGWGGFAVHAARHHGCRVTTTTISSEQHAYCTELVRRAGVADRVRVLLEDYRDLRGRYDKLVSIEMIEAVGWHYFDAFFGCCDRLLERDGLMLLQAIVTSQRSYRQWRNHQGFANTLIFPGGCLPSIDVIMSCLSRTGELRPIHLEDITPHYERTLRSWRENFLRNRGQLDPRRYDERFSRLWTFYLSYCEGAFAERRIRDVQMLLAGPRFRDERGLQLEPVSAAARTLPALSQAGR